jgi:hypothetical protein
MAISIPARLRDEDFATCLVKRYLAPDPATRRARYSGAHFERMGGGGDRPEAACQFTAEDLLAITMLGVRIEGYHALGVLYYQACELNDLLTQIPPCVALQDPQAEALIAEGGTAWRLWDMICDIEPAPRATESGPSQPANSWHISARTCCPSTTAASIRFSTGPAQTADGGTTCATISSVTRTSSASLSQLVTEQARATCPSSASST